MQNIPSSPPSIQASRSNYPPVQGGHKPGPKLKARATQVQQGQDPRFKKVPARQDIRRPNTTERMKKQTTVVDIQKAYSISTSKIASPSKPIPSSALQQSYNLEKTQWSTRYAKDKNFRAKVDVYHDGRTALIADIAARRINPEQIKTRSMELGRQLSVIYEQVSEHGPWNPDSERRIAAGGCHYANWSIRANYLQQAPGIARSAFILAVDVALAAASLEMAQFDPAQYWMAAINATAVMAQGFAFYWVPLKQAEGQSVDVALRSHNGPEYQPNLSASVLVLEDASIGQLQGTKLLEDRIAFLRSLKGSEGDRMWDHIKILRTEYESLHEQITALGEQNAEHVSRANARIYDRTKKLINRFVELDNEIKLLAKFARNLNTDKAIDAEIDRLESKLAAERIYVTLSHQLNQGNSKNFRNLFNIATAVFGLASNVAGASAIGNTGMQVAALVSQIGQVLGYNLFHRWTAGSDYKSLLTVQFQLTALTGVGNLAPKDDKFNPARLDQIVIGPMQRRVTHFKNALEFDRTIYRAAFLTALSDAEGNMPNGSYQRSVLFFSECKTPEARQGYLKSASKLKSITPEGARKAQAILILYEENEKNIKHLNEGKLDELLSDRSTLPDDSKAIFQGALLCAQSHGVEHKSEDNRLAELKGLTESLSDLASVNQAAQKVGQNFLLVAAGPATPLAFKLITNAIQSFAYGFASANFPTGTDSWQALNSTALNSTADTFADYATRKQIINIVGGVGSSAAIVGSIVGLFIAYSAHENIATKELHRGRDRERGAAMPNAGILDYRFSNALFGDHKPTGFKTLAATQIPDADRPDPVGYDRKATLLSDAWEQMKAPANTPLWKYLQLDPAQFDIQTLEEADALAAAYQQKLQAYALELNADNAPDNKPSTSNQPQRSRNASRAGARLSFGKDVIIDIESRVDPGPTPVPRIRKHGAVNPRTTIPPLRLVQREISVSESSKSRLSTGRRARKVSFAAESENAITGLDSPRSHSNNRTPRTRFSRVGQPAQATTPRTPRGGILLTPRGAISLIDSVIDIIDENDNEEVAESKRFLVDYKFVNVNNWKVREAEEKEELSAMDDLFRDMTAIVDDNAADETDQYYLDFVRLHEPLIDDSSESDAEDSSAENVANSSPSQSDAEDSSSGRKSENKKFGIQAVSDHDDSSGEIEARKAPIPSEAPRRSESSDSSIDSTDYRRNILTQLGQVHDEMIVPDLPAIYLKTKRSVWHNLSQLHANIENTRFIGLLSSQEMVACMHLAIAIAKNPDTDRLAKQNANNVLQAIRGENAQRQAEKKQ
ncbi:hypothetical protein [Variovorax sp. PBL-E5]|uniref:hypothetical protein n=1 Tax=Variovorax sp. PBL-E5 TaxID=434014 RepID=UPI001318B0B5|nr:hypothetical protein [Variovorax sp. PBL-E5]VTU35633.1 hypothetical protein E5CHR_04113 [Variovorax sp. PBL-E5]